MGRFGKLDSAIATEQPYGRSLLSLPDRQTLANEVGVAKYERQIYYSDDGIGSAARNIVKPSWAVRCRLRAVGAGSGAGSGAACTATTLAIGGGGGSTGANFLAVDFACKDISSIVLNLGFPGIGGAGVTGTGSVVNGSAGTNGTDTTITVDGAVRYRAAAGIRGIGGTAAGATAQSNANIGGISGANGGVGATNATPAAPLPYTTVNACGGGGGATGFNNSNSSGTGAAGARGGIVERNVIEPATPANTDAIEILVDGIPQPGNGGGGGSSGSGLNGGRGINGGGSGGSPASRTTSLKAPDGARSYAVFEFFGTDPIGTQNPLAFQMAHVLQIETNVSQSLGSSFTTIQFPGGATFDPNACWDFASNHYVIPAGKAGRYLSICKIRLNDNASVGGYGQGVFNSNSDNVYFFWDRVQSGSATNRSAIANQSVTYFNVGDRLRSFAYSDTSVQIVSTSWNLFYLGA